MFTPLSLAVGFAMIASFLLSLAFVPILANLILRSGNEAKIDALRPIKQGLSNGITQSAKYSKLIVPFVVILFLLLAFIAYKNAGSEIFPKVETGKCRFD